MIRTDLKILSLNLGQPETIHFRERTYVTGIRKKPVGDSLQIGAELCTNDSVLDRRFHGGRDKAVYIISTQTYDWWRSQSSHTTLPYGHLGENITLEGLDENHIFVGDVLQLGSVILQVTQPRLPCGTLNAALQDLAAGKKMVQSGMPGVYFRVLKPGTVHRDDVVKWVSNQARGPSISRLFQSLVAKKISTPDRQAILLIEDLAPSLQADLESLKIAD